MASHKHHIAVCVAECVGKRPVKLVKSRPVVVCVCGICIGIVAVDIDQSAPDVGDSLFQPHWIEPDVWILCAVVVAMAAVIGLPTVFVLAVFALSRVLVRMLFFGVLFL